MSVKDTEVSKSMIMEKVISNRMVSLMFICLVLILYLIRNNIIYMLELVIKYKLGRSIVLNNVKIYNDNATSFNCLI
jgi:hypothetical protein